jgi:hypothetical protein
LPPVSGPQIERTLLRAQKEIQEEAEYQAKQGQPAENSDKNTGLIKFAGEAKRGEVTHISAHISAHKSGGGALNHQNGLERASLILQELLGQEKQDAPEISSEDSKPQSQDKPKKKTPIYEYDPILKRNRPVPQFNFKDALPKLNEESILVKGTKYALDQSVQVQPYLPEYEEIQDTQNCVCLTIESNHFSGYLMAAFGYNRKIDQKFFKIVQERLLTFLKSYGEIPKNFESMEITITKVEFEDWAREQAEFLKKSIHGDTEMAMAFFPSQNTQLKIGESVSKKMLSLNLEEIREDSPIEFDTYLFMPNNNRYLLYGAAQGVLYKHQKDRLKKAGIQALHIRKEAVPYVKKYKIQNFLNDKIAKFKAKKNLDMDIAA